MKLQLFILQIALSSCTTVGVNKLTKNLQAKRPSCQLDFYMEQSNVKTKFVNICTVQSNIGIFNSTSTPRADALKNTRKLLCDCGADAVVFLGAGAGTFQRPVSFLGITYKSLPKEKPNNYATGVKILTCRDAGGQWLEDQCSVTDKQAEPQTPNEKRIQQI